MATNFFNFIPVRRTLVIAAAALTLAACSGDSLEILADQRPVAESTTSISATPSTVAAPESSTSSSTSTTLLVESVAISAPPTTAAPTTAAPTTNPPPPSVPEPTVLAPSDVDGSFDDLRVNQSVFTSVGDPLNVRTCPGVSYEILAELDIRPTGSPQPVRSMSTRAPRGATSSLMAKRSAGSTAITSSVRV